MLARNADFEKAAEIAQAVPDPRMANWCYQILPEASLNSGMIVNLESSLGSEVAQVEKVLHDDWRQLHKTHHDVFTKRLQEAGHQNSTDYIEARICQIELAMALKDGKPSMLPFSNRFIWTPGRCSIQSTGENTVEVIEVEPNNPFPSVTCALKLPLSYTLSVDLKLSESDSEAELLLNSSSAYVEGFVMPPVKCLSRIALPKDRLEMHLEIHVEGHKITCLIDEKAAVVWEESQPDLSMEPKYGLPVSFETRVPLTLSNVTIGPAD